jgi:hypothetical protein
MQVQVWVEDAQGSIDGRFTSAMERWFISGYWDQVTWDMKKGFNAMNNMWQRGCWSTTKGGGCPNLTDRLHWLHNDLFTSR